MLLASDFPGEYQVPAGYWLLSVAAAAVFVVGDRWPLPVSVVLSALAVPLFAADAWGLSELVPYLGAVSLAEVAMRTHRTWQVVTATACWTGAVLAGIWVDSHTDFWRPATAVSTVAYVGLPLLLGLYLRAQRDLAVTYRAQAAAAESRRAEAELHAQDRRTQCAGEGTARPRRAPHGIDRAADRGRAARARGCGSAGTRGARRRARDGLRCALRHPQAAGGVAGSGAGRGRAGRVRCGADGDRGRDRAHQGGGVHGFLGGGPGPRRAGRDRQAHPAAGGAGIADQCHEARGPGRRGRGDGGTPKRRGIAVRVTDSGHGAGAPNPAGHGIIGMGERVELVGGTLDVGPTERGWEVDAWLPGVRRHGSGRARQ